MEITEKKVIDSKNGLELQDLRDQRIHMATFKGSVFNGIDMRETTFAETNFVSSKWEHIYFSNLHINMIQMGGTIFENIIRPKDQISRLDGEYGTDGWVNVEPVRFKNSDLSTAVFESCKLQNVEINNCDIEGLRINGILIKDLLEQYENKK
ncbi:hypothetical protein ASG89_01430 [Paenibacillus sp. Soil766]|uniref:pentapeptide repeat-containing protein n=1 Tax=Paenibacillus sp. Soil766 TaxID=1736404 RepID=UPI00070B5C81|nr:pentapeptide repeat-containing protein [Paenibacillus sp. Soil766]KRF10225.1 hypothetical protein ASG89_01430 [Paenibacillus sp. Soil766]